jgi:hypothetical protein
VRAIGNFLWFMLGGAIMGLAWWLFGVLAMLTIVGIPWARAIFLRVGLSNARPMVYAAAIAIGWEGLVGTTPGNLQQLTVQHQAARFLARTVAPETWTLELPLRVPEGSPYVPVVLLIAVTLTFWVVSWRRLRRFELR